MQQPSTGSANRTRTGRAARAWESRSRGVTRRRNRPCGAPRAERPARTAHFPELGWTVTDPRSHNDSGKLTARKSRPLIGLGYAGGASVGWDGRSPTLEAQAKASVATGSMSMREADTPVKVEVIEDRVRSEPRYAAKFQSALPGRPINIDTIVQAIAAFERTLEMGLAPFDRWVDGATRHFSSWRIPIPRLPQAAAAPWPGRRRSPRSGTCWRRRETAWWSWSARA